MGVLIVCLTGDLDNTVTSSISLVSQTCLGSYSAGAELSQSVNNIGPPPLPNPATLTDVKPLRIGDTKGEEEELVRTSGARASGRAAGGPRVATG